MGGGGYRTGSIGDDGGSKRRWLVGVRSICLYDLTVSHVACALDHPSQALHSGQLDGALHLDTSNITRHTNNKSQIHQVTLEVCLICGGEALALNAAMQPIRWPVGP